MSQPLPAFRVGLGYDIHPLVAGRPCILGGVNIPSPVGPEGHSDADVLLHAVAEAKGQGGWVVGNVDIVIIGERPKVMAHVDAMKAKVAEIIGISASQVGIKATTNEGMDSIGQGKALAVQAICLISKGF